MKKITVSLLSSIFLILIAGSIESVTADHLEPGQGIFVSEGEVSLVTTQDTNYQVYVQIVVRNVDGQLVGVTENTKTGAYIPHAISDYVFDTLMDKKEIITIDDVKYEKAQWKFSPSLEERIVGIMPIYSEVNLEFTAESDDIAAKMQEMNNEYSLWKMHYCSGGFEGHSFSCVPVFQVIVPNMTLDPGDTVDLLWMVLRELE